jgi:hypothetical protein
MQNPRLNERQPLLRRQSLRLDYEAETGEIPTPPAGGTILGIHNLAIVIPQFLVRHPTAYQSMLLLTSCRLLWWLQRSSVL